MSAFPRQMYQTRGQHSGASGSVTASFRSPERIRATTWSTTSCSVVAPAARAFRTTSSGLSFHCGKNGSQPFLTAFTWRSIVWPRASDGGRPPAPPASGAGTGWYSVNSAS